jgi:hypothetical protein
VGRAYGTHGSGEKSTGFSWESPRPRWEDGIRMDLRDNGWGGGVGMDSVGSGHEPVAGSCVHGDESLGSGTTEFVN